MLAALAASGVAAADLPAPLASIRKLAEDYAAVIGEKRKGLSEAASTAVQKAKVAGDDGNWAEAVRHLEVAAGATPRSFPVLIRLARAWQNADGSDKRGQAAALLAYELASVDRERLEALTLLDGLVRLEAEAVRSKIDFETKRYGALLERMLAESAAHHAPLIKEREIIERSRLDYALRYGRLVDANRAIVKLVTAILGRPMKDAGPPPPHDFNPFFILNQSQSGAPADQADGDDTRDPSDADASESSSGSGQSSGPVAWSTTDKTLRACVRFSMPLRQSATFYKLRHIAVLERRGDGDEPRVPFNLNVRGNEVCFLGLKHESAYTFVFKQGMPDQTGFSLAADQQITASAPKAPSLVRFNSRAYVMPANATGSVAITALRAPFVRLSLYRVGDRGVSREAASGTVGTNFLSDARDFKENRAEKLWSGLLEMGAGPAARTSSSIPFAAILEARKRWMRSLADVTEPVVEREGEARIGDNFAEGRFYGGKGSYQSGEADPAEAGLYILVAERLPDFSKDDEVQAYKNLDAADEVEKREAGGEKESVASEASAGWTGTHTSTSGDTLYSIAKRYRVSLTELLSANAITSPSRLRPGTVLKVPSVTARPVVASAQPTGKADAVQWIVVTDIGLSYYRGGESVYAVARSLRSGEALADTQVQLISAGNRVLGSARTDAAGVAEFPVGLSRGRQGNRLATIFAYHEADFSLIDPNKDIFDLSAHGLQGRRPPQLADAYVYTDRGLYRPGEAIHAFVLLKGIDGQLIKDGLPLKIRVLGAKGAALSDVVQLRPAELSMGGVAVKLPIARTALLGAADVEALLGEKVIGKASVQVAHFQPDRARIELLDVAEKIAADSPGARILGGAQANYLYGGRTRSTVYVEAPASNLLGELQLLIAPTTSPFGGCYEKHAFGDAEQSFPPFMTRHAVGPTGADGRLGYDIALPDIPRSDLPLKASVSLSLFDVAGRIGSKTQQFVLKRDANWLGVRVDARDAAIGRGLMRVRFNLLALDRENKPRRPERVSVEIYRELVRYHWYEKGGNWSFGAGTEKVAEQTLSAAPLAPTLELASCRDDTHSVEHDLPVGDYTLVVKDSDGAQTTSRFIVGASSTGTRAQPEVLPIRGYRSEFRAGETVELKVDGQFDGHVLAAIVQGDRVVDWVSVPAPRGQADISLPVPRVWAGSQLHVLATLFRSNTDGSIQQGPARAVGVHRFRVAEQGEQFDVGLEGTPRKLASGAELPIMLTLRNDDGTPFNGTAMVALAAVDEGIISLTDHKAPDPAAYFFGPRRMTLDVLDNYGRLLLNDRPAERSGGDDVTGYLSRVLGENVRPERLFARMHFEPKGVLFENGVARINPGWGNFANFDGSIRLVALVWTDRSVGTASTHVLVRGALVSSLGVPRYVAPGDRLRAPLLLENLEAVEGIYAVRLAGPNITEITDHAGAPVIGFDGDSFNVELNRGQRKLFWVHLSVPRDAPVGQLKYELKWQFADSRLALNEASKAFSINIHEPAPPATVLAGTRRLGPGEKLALSPDLLPPALARRLRSPLLQVRFGPTPTLLTATSRFVPPTEVIGSLEALVWNGMTLLARPDGSGLEDVGFIVQDLIGLQNEKGGFDEHLPQYAERTAGSGSSESPVTREHPNTDDLSREVWRTALVADILAQYRARSADVDLRLGRAFVMLQKELLTALADDRAAHSATSCSIPYLYAAIVLAAANRITDDDLVRQRQLCPTDGMGSLESAMLAAAAVSYGRIDSANVLLASLPRKLGSDDPAAAGNGSQQQSAMLLAFLARARAPDSLVEAALLSFIDRAQGTDELSASAVAWLAQTSSARRRGSNGATGKVQIEIEGQSGLAADIVEGRSDEDLTTKFISLQSAAGGGLVAVNRSAGPVVATIFARGGHDKDRSSTSDRISLQRSFYDEMGRPLPGDEPVFIQNRLYYVVLEGAVKEASGNEDATEGSDIVISDYLPAGFEVAAKTILPGSSGANPARAALGESMGRQRYAETLDDRLVAIVDPSRDEATRGQFRVLYAVRPTLTGELTLPVATLEKLRKPDVNFVTGNGGSIKVLAKPQ